MLKTISIDNEFERYLNEYKKASGINKDSTAIRQAVFIAIKFFLPKSSGEILIENNDSETHE